MLRKNYSSLLFTYVTLFELTPLAVKTHHLQYFSYVGIHAEMHGFNLLVNIKDDMNYLKDTKSKLQVRIDIAC